MRAKPVGVRGYARVHYTPDFLLGCVDWFVSDKHLINCVPQGRSYNYFPSHSTLPHIDPFTKWGPKN